MCDSVINRSNKHSMPKTLIVCKECQEPLVSKYQRCWECGENYCESHLTLCSRCMKWKLCAKDFATHPEYCRRHEKARGPLPTREELGSGNQSVYVWFNEVEEREAHSQGLDRWLCKIGKTNGSPTARILGQGAVTAYGSDPTLGLVLCTDDAVALEQIIHGMLKCAGRHNPSAPGNEWYRTSPSEVKAIYLNICSVLSQLSTAT